MKTDALTEKNVSSKKHKSSKHKSKSADGEDKHKHKKSKKSKKHKRDHEDDSEEQPVKEKKARVESASSEPSTTSAAVDVSAWLNEHQIKIEDIKGEQWRPMLSFSDVKLSDGVMDVTKQFSKPTPIQAATWPILLKNRDVVGIAETGSGKTLAFGLPALSFFEQRPKKSSRQQPCILALAPTRELASQIYDQFVAASQAMKLKSVCIYGGMPKYEQKNLLKAGVDVIVACPGRLLDLVNEGACDLGQVGYVVLDEADRMLDLGFEKEVRKIIAMTNAERQVVMFSATWPAQIQKLAGEFLRNPVKVTVGSEDLGASSTVTQIVEVIEPYEKENRLIALLQDYHKTRKNRVLVFCLYKKEAARLEQSLQRRGWQCVAIHGDMKQHERNQNFGQFKSGQVPLLIATDVAARGLDIPNVEYVINFTFPLTIEDYVHRIGRTGRAGNKGISHTFFTQHDKARAGELNNLLRQMKQEVPEDLMRFGMTVKKKEHAAYGAFFREIDENAKPTKIVFDSDGE